MSNNATCVIVGNLTKDPVQQNWKGTTVVSFPVAVNTTKKDGEKYISDFYNVSVWGKTAEYIMPRLQKGTQVQVIGALQLQSYKDKTTGNERQSLSLRANDVLPLARQKDAPSRDGENDNSPDMFF